MGLKEYQKKRDFAKTAEPKPAARAKKNKGQPIFVIQKHDASRLHYDFRLEMEGVLKSWAVPKGVPYARGEKHLAVHVEDHPFDYKDFEGIIPKGNYGGGTVMVWDFGTYEMLGGDALENLKAGKMHFLLHGKKLEGEWALIQINRANEENQWLLFKAGEDVPALSAKRDDESALTGRSLKKIAADKDAEWNSNRGMAAEARAAKREPKPKKKAETGPRVAPPASLPKAPPDFVFPMKARTVEEPPRTGNWIYELKLDGYRAIAVKDGASAELISRNKKPLTERFPEVVEAVRQLGATQLVLDGEIVALDAEGRPSFQLLQASEMEKVPPTVVYYLFDLINLEGRDLRGLGIAERKELLKQVLEGVSDPLRHSVNIEGDVHELLREIKRLELEGIVGKRAGSKYESGDRSGAWIKLKVVNEQEFVIGGYTPPQGTRKHFGAVLVGYYERGEFLFAGRVGTGFDTKTLASLYKQFQPLRVEKCPFLNLPSKQDGKWKQGVSPSEMRSCTWLKQTLVCQVKFSQWTRDGLLRHPAFLGTREDKAAAEVVREKAGAS